MKIKTKKSITYGLSAISFLFALFIYAMFREPQLYLDKAIGFLGLQEAINTLRIKIDHLAIPDWILYGMPDLLWMFSFMLLILTIWNFRLNNNSLIWILATILIGLAFEFLQASPYLQGVFDWKDVFFLILGMGLAFLFTIKK